MSLNLHHALAKRVALGHAVCALSAAMASAAWEGPTAPPSSSTVLVRFIDSATGYALQPDIEARPHRAGAVEKRFGPAHVDASGHAALALEHGSHTLTVASPGYQPMSEALEVREHSPHQIQVLLDPLELPRELRREDIEARQREGETLIQGFIVDDDSGEPLRGVQIESVANSAKSFSDSRGFYEIYLPVLEDAAQTMAGVNVTFEKDGYQIQEHQYWELWSRGDWTHNIRLQRGGGRQIVDRRQQRREMPPDKPAKGQGATAGGLESSLPSASASRISISGAPVIEPQFAPPEPTDPTSATVRVPRNIRVEDNGVIYYVTMNFYEKHVLPHEWISSWGSTTGGSNSLNAGAVAVRSYAINRVNNRSADSQYDICGSSDCQNFKTTDTSSYTDKAVDYTSGCVLVNAGGNIASTEYSGENNSIDRGSCGDGFTAPTGGCLYDPICAGHARVGHGRGMCQRGSYRWAKGTGGFPRRDWVWIIYHYYPNLRLARGTPLVVGDNIRAETTVNVRACADGGIAGGVTCPLITTKATGQSGVIIGGPLVVTNDSKGFTWYQVRWNDAGSTIGWSCENYLERLFSAPSAPASLAATAAATNRINLSWTDPGSTEAGFLLERAPAVGGPWIKIAQLEANVTAFSDGNLHCGSTWCYRVLAFNAAGNSAYSAVATATTPSGVPPTLSPVQNLQVTPGTLITFTNIATAPERLQLITDFEPFMSETANGVVVFRTPNFSTSTSGFLNSAPDMDIAAVTDTYPNTGHGTGMALYVHCNFTNGSNPWLRLTTGSAQWFPNPVIDFARKLRFDIYADQAVKVAIGCRETTTPAGTVIGADGGVAGASIEWAGVTNIVGTAPAATRAIASNTWTTLTFDLPNEPIRSFSGGNGVLSTASGLGVLEQLAIVPAGLNNVPAGSSNIYNLYFDNIAVVVPRSFTYSLGPGAPTNASLNAASGVFRWTPNQSQSLSTNQISIIVTDNSSPPLSATNTFSVIVQDNIPASPPLLAPINNRTAYVGIPLVFTNSAYDPNPGDALTFSLDPGAPPAATIHPLSGVFSWTASSADTNSVHSITVRVTDNSPGFLSATASFSVTVTVPPPPNQAPMLFPINNRSINAGSTLTFTNQAFDPDGDAYTFSLGAGAPPGASIEPSSGLFIWTPQDLDTNTTRTITVRATDDGVPPLSAWASFNVTVLPRLPNHAPTLMPVADRTVHAGSAVVFTNSASDSDAADTLSFSLDETAPFGAEIDIVSGVFAWTPTDDQSNTTNHITVSVSDDGEPSLAASASFSVTVRSKPVLQAVSVSGTAATLTWSAISNVTYRLQYKTNLLDSLWQTLGPDITATNTAPTAVDAGLSGNPRRFYRVRVMN